jgi:dihydroorotate dehydrogenase (fumarate)
MADLKTTFVGLALDNPFIMGSCGLTKSVEGVQRAAEAGAGAVVLKSLFEEEIRLDYAGTTDAFADYPHPEAAAYLDADIAAHYGPEKYLRLVEEASAAVDVPVIASVNCVSGTTWTTFAEQLESAGAAAIELNIYVVPLDAAQTSQQVEEVYIDAVRSVRARVKIPVIVKTVPYVTNLVRFALGLQDAGANGLVLFNRFFHPDIDLQSEELKGGLVLSRPDEYRAALRWIGVLYGRGRGDLCASTGIHDGETAARLLLSGADAVQVVSAVYAHGRTVFGQMKAELSAWMDDKGYENISDFHGKLSRFRLGDHQAYERAQYIKAFVGAE